MEATPPKSEEPTSPVKSRHFPAPKAKIKAEDLNETSKLSSSYRSNAVPLKSKTPPTYIKTEEKTEAESPTNSSAADLVAPKLNCADAEQNSSGLSEAPSSYDPGSSSGSEGPSDDEDDQDVNWRKSKLDSKRNRSNEKKKRFLLKNAREYVAWLHAKEDEEEDTKRKRKEEQSPPRKSRKTSRQRARKQSGTLLDHLNDINDEVNNTAPDSNAPGLPAIKATTHAAQFTQLLRSIPSNCDTRHTNTQKQDLRQAVKLFGYKKVKATNGTYLLNGMLSSLEPYQQTASAWMVKRELARTKPFGGMLGDSMGLGKTVVSLNTIVGNPPDAKDIEEFSGTTLIVVPNRDIAVQWKTEIKKHCATKRTSLIYSRNAFDDVDDLKSQWIVITTYPDLISQFPKQEELRELIEKYDTDSWSLKKALRAKLGRLFQVDWYRVILDEAHAINNHNSSSAKACWELKSKHRWVLSGTPLSNKAEEFYPYLKFLDCGLTGSLKDYKMNYYKTDGRFDALIALIMYRRTTKDKFLGHSLISLPVSQVHEIWVPLSKEEEVIYEAVDRYYAHEVAKRKEQRKKEEKLFQEMLDREIIGGIKTSLGDQEKVPIAQQLQKGENFTTGLSKYAYGLQRLGDMDSLGGTFDMEALLTLAENEHLVKNLTCPGCVVRNPPLNPVQAVNLQGGDSLTTPACIQSIVDKDRKFKEAGRDSNGVQLIREKGKNFFFMASCRKETGVSMPPSSKLAATMAVLMTWSKEAPEDKIIGKFNSTSSLVDANLEISLH
ncbi:hypothetical protein QQZ08_011811 [Neonectria magnoliae]|uniref:Helicase ATP-binding domain-containing protein n=1 Tax=Neonectria magnoliae TaxID=2732573 RepID=A0ABR1H798_9HYPO